jgi:hypothetical protein
MSILLFTMIGLFVLPLLVSTVLHFSRGRIVDWRNADRSSVALLPPALAPTEAVARVIGVETEIGMAGVLVHKQANSSCHARCGRQHPEELQGHHSAERA